MNNITEITDFEVTSDSERIIDIKIKLTEMVTKPKEKVLINS